MMSIYGEPNVDPSETVHQIMAFKIILATLTLCPDEKPLLNMKSGTHQNDAQPWRTSCLELMNTIYTAKTSSSYPRNTPTWSALC